MSSWEKIQGYVHSFNLKEKTKKRRVAKQRASAKCGRVLGWI